MNEKIIFIFACVVFFVGCASTRIPDNRNGADAVREHIDQLGAQQTELAITGTELENRIERSTDAVGELERTITNGAGNLAAFKAILQQIRKRSSTDTGGT